MPDLKVINLASRKDADLEHNRTEVVNKNWPPS